MTPIVNDRFSFLGQISPTIEMFIAISVVDPKGQNPQGVLRNTKTKGKHF
jgi:hypothetical protein